GSGRVDLMATARRRSELRAERAARAGGESSTDGASLPPEVSATSRVSENVWLGAAGEARCAHCGGELAESIDGLLGALACIEGPARLAGPQIAADPAEYTDEPVVFRQYLCPHCHVASLTHVVLASREEREDTVE